MKWNVADISIFIQEKEYIDTAVIPVIPITLDQTIKKSAEQGEFIQLLLTHLEKQFQGRVVLFPPFTYMESPACEKNRLHYWHEKIKEAGFHYVFFITADERWLSYENEYSILYISSIPLEHVNSHLKQSILDEQLKTLIPNIIKMWQRK